MVDDMGMAEEAIDDALVESAGYDDDNTGDENTIIQLVNQNKELEASLDEAEALIKKNAALMNGYLARIAELESQIIHQTAISACRIEERERLRAQVAALQEIAVEGRAYIMELERCMIGFMENNGPGISEAEAIDELALMKSERTRDDEARRWLSEEHPEAFR